MKNKNGFTLIELLGAIVILAILSLIAIPTVTNTVKGNKQKLYDTQIKNIEIAARNWASDNRDKLPDKGQSITIKLSKLQNEGYLEKNMKNPKNGKKFENVDIIILNRNNKFIYKVNSTISDSSTIYSGKEFNSKIKTLASGSEKGYYSSDDYIKKISFYSNGDLPEGYTKKTIEELSNVSVSDDDKVKAYYNSNKNEIYIYSENQIYANPDSSYMFAQYYKLIELNLKDLDTSNVTNMSYMFEVIPVSKLDLSNFDTSNVTDMSYMFNCVLNIENLDLSSFDTSNVTNMKGMFYESWFTTIDLSSFDTSKVTDMSSMFSAGSLSSNKLKVLDLSSFNTSNVTNMRSMFSERTGLKTIILSNFDTSKVTDMGGMFERCLSLTSLDLSNFDTSKTTNMEYMFHYASNLNKIIVTKGKWVIGSSTNTSNMFENCGTDKVTIK